MFLDIFLIILVLVTAGGAAVLFLKLNQKVMENSQLNREKHNLDNIVASMDDGVIVYDSDFKIEIFNSGAGKIFNIAASEIIGKKLAPENASDSKLGVLAKIIFQSLAPLVIRQSPEGIYPQVVDISFADPFLELRVTTDRMLNSKGEAVSFLKIIRDRTREIELIKSKSEFITVAAHQLRTPLSAVSWAIQSLKSEKLSDSQKELLITGEAAAGNLLKIVEDLLKIATIEEGKFGYNFKKIDLVAFLQSALNQALPVAKEYNINLYLEPPQEISLSVEADPEKLVLAVSNLLENAIKYNIPNGRVVIKVAKQTDTPFLQVDISDTGIGIPAEAMDKLFTKFFRAENALTKETTGSGLGLYIVKNIITSHGGQIWAESEAGRGTTFHFTLPTDPRLIPQREIVSQ